MWSPRQSREQLLVYSLSWSYHRKNASVPRPVRIGEKHATSLPFAPTPSTSRDANAFSTKLDHCVFGGQLLRVKSAEQDQRADDSRVATVR